MSEYNWDLFKCRCSKINDFMAASRSNPCLTEIQKNKLDELEKKPSLTAKQMEEMAKLNMYKKNAENIVFSDGAIEYMMEYYAWVTAEKLSVGKELNMIEYCEKGTAVEPQSITLLSLVEEVYYSDNKHKQIFNDYSTGEPDIFVGEKGHEDDPYRAKKITDIKSSFDYPIYLKKIKLKPDVGNDKQVKGYMDITGAKEGQIAHCLVNMPIDMILGYEWALFRKMRPVTEEDPAYKEACIKMRKSMVFDNIDKHKRVFKIPVTPFTDFERQQFHDKVKAGRDYLWQFDEEMEQLNK